MSTSLLEQLDTYFDQVDAGQAPITTREVEDRLGAGEVKPPLAASSRRGLLVAAATALIVLLLGVIPFLIRAWRYSGCATTCATTPTSRAVRAACSRSTSPQTSPVLR